MTGRIVQINISPGGIPKRPVLEANLTPHGVEGDSWNHPGIHGGPRKAVLLLGAEFAYAWSQPPGPPGPPVRERVLGSVRGLFVHHEDEEPPGPGVR